jgi:predicted ATP-dependent protease
MSAAAELVRRLEHRADEMASGYVRPQWVSDREMLRAAADMIEAMARRIVTLEKVALLGEDLQHEQP